MADDDADAAELVAARSGGAGLWPMTTLMLRSFSLLGLWPMTSLRGLWPVVLVETQATQPKTHRLDSLLLHKAGLLALPAREW